MQARKKLDLDALAVDSFATAADAGARGTVRAHESEPAAPNRGCTCLGTCLCPTAYYNCGTGPYTIYSCEYTANNSCHV